MLKCFYEFNFLFYVFISSLSSNCLVLLSRSWKLLFQLAINFVSKEWIKLILRILFSFSIGIGNCILGNVLVFNEHWGSLIFQWLIQRLFYFVIVWGNNIFQKLKRNLNTFKGELFWVFNIFIWTAPYLIL